MGRKRFIDKKNCAHFQLVHNYTNGDDENAPTRSLMPYVPTRLRKKGVEVSEEAEAFADKINLDESKPRVVDEDLEGDCYFPKDGYDYSQHLRATEQLSYEVPLTEEQEDALNYAVPKNKVEEEALAALADADAYESGDEDFFDELLGGDLAEDTELMLWGEEHHPEMMALNKKDPFAKLPEVDIDEYLGDSDEDDMDEGICTLPVRANRDLDEELANILEQYDDDQIGELDEEEAMGAFDMSTFDVALDEYAESRRTFKDCLNLARKEDAEEAGENATYVHAHLGLDRDEEPLLSDEEYEVRTVSVDETWDIESLASMRSNLSNHPGKIDRVKAHGGKPKKEKKIDLEPINEDNTVVLPDVDTFRPKDETADEKKARKNAVKEQRRICREMKKQNKQVWKGEADKLRARCANHGADVRSGVRVVPI